MSKQEHWSSPNGCHEDCPACEEETPQAKRISIMEPEDAIKRLRQERQQLLDACLHLREHWTENLTESMALINDAIDNAL